MRKGCVMMTEYPSVLKQLSFQGAGAHKALLSVYKYADLGYDCVLGKKQNMRNMD